jgi:flagellar export protein FliJ
MTTFRFPLKRVLDWRRTQLELEEARYKRQAAVLAELDRARAEIEAEGIRAEVQVREWNPIAGRDLEALSTFRVRVKSREAQLAAQRADCAKKLAEQRQAMLEARRRCKLLERLEERKLAEWRATRNRELDELAAESYLVKWK